MDPLSVLHSIFVLQQLGGVLLRYNVLQHKEELAGLTNQILYCNSVWGKPYATVNVITTVKFTDLGLGMTSEGGFSCWLLWRVAGGAEVVCRSVYCEGLVIRGKDGKDDGLHCLQNCVSRRVDTALHNSKLAKRRPSNSKFLRDTKQPTTKFSL